MKLHRLLLTAAFLGGSVIGASAQTATPNAGANATVSAATHCKDAATGQVKLKSAMNSGSGMQAGGSATTGSGSPTAAGSPAGTAKGNTAGTAQRGGASSAQSGAGMGASAGAAANLPNC